MNTLALLLLALQASGVEVRDRGATVSVTFTAPKHEPLALVEVARERIVPKEYEHLETAERTTTLVPRWESGRGALAAEEGRNWRARVELPESGRYEVRLGKAVVCVRVSRSHFKRWKEDLDGLRECADRALAVAKKMDEAPGVLKYYKKLQDDLNRERARLDMLRTDYTAAPVILRQTLDSLWYIPFVLEGRVAAGQRDALSVSGKAAKAADGEILRLKDYFVQEATVRLLDELLLILGDKEKDEQIVLRWKDRDAALSEISQCQKDLGSEPESPLELMIKAAVEKTEEDAALVERMRSLRRSLIR